MNRWPEVVLGGDHEPYIDRVADEMPYLTRPKTVAAYGTVQGYPWSLVLFEKEGDPEDDEEMAPDYVAPPQRAEFFLGGSPSLPGSQAGGLGGGGGPIHLPPGVHIDTTAHTWATSPPVIGYVIFTSDEVSELRVSPDGAEGRSFTPERPVEGFPQVCVFFPPFAVPGDIIALDATGLELRRRRLISGDVHVGGTFGGGD